MKEDFIITLAWPEGMTTAAGAWYDAILSKNGKYRVGHAALLLVNSATSKIHYFDFGRYHTPIGYGRVRDAETDPDVRVIDAKINDDTIQNIKEILLYVSKMKSTYSKGRLYASVVERVSFTQAYKKAKEIQKKGMLHYGPFVIDGTNCSRFVAKVIINSGVSAIKKLRLKYPFCISPSPKRNVSICNNNYYVVEGESCIEVKKSILEAYFTSIEV